MKNRQKIIIIGGGIAALQTAKHLQQHFDVHIFMKGNLQHSSSYRAQGGIAAVMSATDSLSNHITDTLQAGVHHHQQQHVELLVTDGQAELRALIAQGLPIDRTNDGIALGLEGAHCHNRIVHAGGDATGRITIDFLYSQCQDVTFHMNEMVTRLLLNNQGQCIGITTKLTTHLADYVILATGGAGDVYAQTSNCDGAVGDGIALAYQAGAAITDMEFMQFHPTLLYGTGHLVSEAVRGAGATLVDEQQQPIMAWHPLGNLAPRHITAHTIHQLRAQGQAVYLAINTVQHFSEKFPTITAACRRAAIDLTTGNIPVAPGSHFLMGGVMTNDVGETTIPRLLAVGEVAWTGVHGANRLASNSLLEGIVFGKRLALHLLHHAQQQENWHIHTTQRQHITTLLEKQHLQQLMMQHAGIIRSPEGLKTLCEQLPTLQQLYTATHDDAELFAMHITATFIVQAALTRTETRGAHIRSDYHTDSDMWQQQYIIFEQGQMKVRTLQHEPVKA